MPKRSKLKKSVYLVAIHFKDGREYPFQNIRVEALNDHLAIDEAVRRTACEPEDVDHVTFDGPKDNEVPDLHELAKQFCFILREWLTQDELKRVNLRNARRGYDGSCATHEFCDPNEAMLMAWSRCGVDLTIGWGDNVPLSTDAQTNAWVEAWTIAREARFNPYNS